MKIKVCGLKYYENVLEVFNLNPDYLGFIFYKKSPRYVDFKELERINTIAEIKDKKVAVFVNEDFNEVVKICNANDFIKIQLHGEETPEYCAKLKEEGFAVIKAISVGAKLGTDIASYKGVVDFFLFDTKCDEYGGSGKSFNWEALSSYDLDIPYFLSGGLSPDNTKNALELNSKSLFALDVNSGYEKSAAIKDIDKLKELFRLVRDE